MKRFVAGSQVGSGYYWNARHWSFTHVGPLGDTLAGEAGESFVKVPFGVALLAAPVAGLLFIVFLPFIGFALGVGLLARRVAQKVQGGATGLAEVVQPPMATGAAYLTGSKPAEKAEPTKDASLDELAQEVDARRSPKS